MATMLADAAGAVNGAARPRRPAFVVRSSSPVAGARPPGGCVNASSLVLTAALLAALAPAARAEEGEPEDLEAAVRRQHLDKRAPELLGVVGVAGKPAPRLAALRGKVVLLEFYAGWCPNCRALSPALARLHERYKDRGLELVGITNDEPAEAARVAREWRIPYPVGCAAADLPYAAVALPTAFLIDRRGVVREVMLGASPESWATLQRRVRELLEEKG